MGYLENMPETCREHATRPEHALDLLQAILNEFDKSFSGGIFDPFYVLPKIDSLRSHVKWLALMAKKESFLYVLIRDVKPADDARTQRKREGAEAPSPYPSSFTTSRRSSSGVPLLKASPSAV
jgi:hypothetical protein